MHQLKEIRKGFIYEPQEESELAILAGNTVAAEVGSLAGESPQGPGLAAAEVGKGTEVSFGAEWQPFLLSCLDGIAQTTQYLNT